jgi:hypothetical protein
MSDQQIGPVLGAWFKGMDSTPPEAHQSTRQVMARLPQVRQRGRWWPVSLLQRPAAPAPAMPDTEFQPTPIPATNGRVPTVTGRTMPMFSATKFVIAGVIVALFGGFLLIGQPFEQQRGRVFVAWLCE